jgi:hypothetical protein
MGIGIGIALNQQAQTALTGRTAQLRHMRRRLVGERHAIVAAADIRTFTARAIRAFHRQETAKGDVHLGARRHRPQHCHDRSKACTRARRIPDCHLQCSISRSGQDRPSGADLFAPHDGFATTSDYKWILIWHLVGVYLEPRYSPT